MNRFANVIVAIALAGGCSLNAQNLSTHIGEGKKVYANIKNNLIGLADKMPEDAYSFKPTPDIRSFGQLMAHIADAQTRMCSAASGQQKQANAASKTTKAELVAAVKESIALRDAAWDSLNDAAAFETVKMGPMERSKLGLLEYNSAHSNEEYGYGAVYLRLKGLTPPSSEKR
jgi:uncharacterized damage-inducible protein DinB